MFWKTDTPGARMAAASCFSPEFFVAPETLISPSSGAPTRTRKYSVDVSPMVPPMVKGLA
jgi:hypothetical protein